MTQSLDSQNKIREISGQLSACEAAYMTNISEQGRGEMNTISNDGIIIYAANSSLEAGYQSKVTSPIERSQSILKVSENIGNIPANSHELHGIFEDFEIEKKRQQNIGE